MSLLPKRNRDEEPNGSGSSDRELFRYEARRDGRPVALFRAVQAPDEVIVETEVFPVTARPGEEGIPRPFAFATADQARRFVDEALTALEYLNCSVA